MALGCDTYFAETVLEKKSQHPELILEAVLPCPGQADRWKPEDRHRYEALLLQCDRVTVLEDAYSEGCMFRRNQELVDRADLLISVYDGAGGGTGNTVQYARKCGGPILPVWL